MNRAAASPVAHFPRLPLMGMFGIAALAMLAAGVARLEPPPSNLDIISGEAVAQRTVMFGDMSSGGISVRDAVTGETIAEVAPGTNGFLRGALRGMGRVRKIDGGMRTDPYRLTLWESQHVTLEDMSNGVIIDLNAFGPTNASVFRAFLATDGEESK